MSLPIIAGWLEKKGHLIKNWKRRYCYVESSSSGLCYYLDETKQQLKGHILFDSSTRILIRDGKNHLWKFKIITNGKELELAAITEEERDHWVITLKDLLGISCEYNRSSSMSMSRSTMSSQSQYVTTSSSTLNEREKSIKKDEDKDYSIDSDDEFIQEEKTILEEEDSTLIHENPPPQPQPDYMNQIEAFSPDILPDLDDLLGK